MTRIIDISDSSQHALIIGFKEGHVWSASNGLESDSLSYLVNSIRHVSHHPLVTNGRRQPRGR